MNLEFSIVWATRRPYVPGVRVLADGVRVGQISTALDPVGRVAGTPERLVANRDIAFYGTIILGLGFTMSEGEARALIERDRRNAEVLFPYVNGEDLNSRPDSSASRWVINFFDWNEEKARQYSDCWAIVDEEVRPERTKLIGRNATANDRAKHWWRYGRRADALYGAIAGLDRVLTHHHRQQGRNARLRLQRGGFSNATVVFATDDPAMLALLSSAPHYWWAICACLDVGNPNPLHAVRCVRDPPPASDHGPAWEHG